jgi:hypothetical protein
MQRVFAVLQVRQRVPKPAVGHIRHGYCLAFSNFFANFADCSSVHAVTISEDLAWVDRGALPGVLRIHHDEASVPGLNVARFITARTHEGRTGFYLTNPNVMSENGSDFELLQYRRVWDRAYRIVRRATLPFLSQDIEVNPAGVASPLVAGGIDEVEAGNIEDKTVDALEDGLVKTTPKHATVVGASVDRTTNFLSTRNLVVQWTVQPKGYIKAITGTLGFTNPARTAA